MQTFQVFLVSEVMLAISMVIHKFLKNSGLETIYRVWQLSWPLIIDLDRLSSWLLPDLFNELADRLNEGCDAKVLQRGLDYITRVGLAVTE